MRPRNSHTLFAGALVLAVLMLVVTAADASATRAGRNWRSSRYGRKGAEIWAEFPRVTLPMGAGYREEYDVTHGMGFGFGLMWGISDNLALEGRILQTNHTTGSGDEEQQWDIDHIKIGPRFTFFTENRLQPFAGVGWSKLTLERDAGEDSSLQFERLTGYGAYITLGVDYIHNSQWSAFLRVDYTHGGYGHLAVGLDEGDLDETLSGNCASAALGISYRIPAW